MNYAPAHLTKDKLLLHHIDTLIKKDVKIDNVNCLHFIGFSKIHLNPYKTRVVSNFSHCFTTILSKHIASALTAVTDHVIKYSVTSFSNSNTFWSIKTPPKSSKSCVCGTTVRILKYLLLTFPLHTPHCHMILSNQKCCLLVNSVSIESRKRTSISQTKLMKIVV